MQIIYFSKYISVVFFTFEICWKYWTGTSLFQHRHFDCGGSVTSGLLSEFLRSAVTNARKGIPAINDALRDETHRMTNSTNFAVALALILATIMTVAAAGNKYHSPADAGDLPFPAKPGNETPFLATKDGRLHVRSEIRGIAGVIVVLRDFDRTIR